MPDKSDYQPFMKTAGGKITCKRCQAMSKRTRAQCASPAIKGKRVCRFHGGKSTGWKTLEGRNKAILSNTTYGHETRSMRKKRVLINKQLLVLSRLIEVIT